MPNFHILFAGLSRSSGDDLTVEVQNIFTGQFHRPTAGALILFRNDLTRFTLGKTVSLAPAQALRKAPKSLTADQSETELS
jgi:hypothetical protein